MGKYVVLGLIVTTVLGGCSPSAQSDVAFRKLMLGYNGLTCAEGYQESLNDGDSQERADTYYETCIAQRS